MNDNKSFPLLSLTRGGSLEDEGVEIGNGMELLETICSQFPNRPVGSSGEHGQAEYVSQVLKDAGVERVALEPVRCLSTDFDYTELRYPDPNGTQSDAVPMAFTGSTPDNGITADLVYSDSVDFVDFKRADLKGKILFVFGGFGEYSTIQYYRAACEAGLAGVIVVRDREYATCYYLSPEAAACGNVPVVSVSYKDGLDIMKSGATTAYLNVKIRIEEVTGYNVVGMLPANSDKIDDQVLLVSAHMDAKPIRPSAADNGAGTVMAVEVMRVLAKVKRGRDIWFAGYTNEEYGFSGSLQFPKDHPDVVRQCALQLYYDGHGSIIGRNELVVSGDDGLAEFMKNVAMDIQHPMKTTQRANTLDPVVLFSQDVPAIQVARTPQRTWHTNYDTPDDIAPQVMRAGIHLYAEAGYRLVNMPEIPFKRWVNKETRSSGEAVVKKGCPATFEEAKKRLKG